MPQHHHQRQAAKPRPRGEPSLAVQMKARMAERLRICRPADFPAMRLSTRRWSTGGEVVIQWMDGPAETGIRDLLSGLCHGSIISLRLERRYSLAFLSRVVTAYCTAAQVAPPAIHDRGQGAYIHPLIDTALYRALRGEVMALDAAALADLVYVRGQDGTIRRSVLQLKKDYSAGIAPAYAVIGRQGYAKMSGPHEWFDIYPVAQRVGKHRVKIAEGTGYGYGFRSVAQATAALRQLAATGKIAILYTDGQWHY